MQCLLLCFEGNNAHSSIVLVLVLEIALVIVIAIEDDAVEYEYEHRSAEHEQEVFSLGLERWTTFARKCVNRMPEGHLELQNLCGGVGG